MAIDSNLILQGLQGITAQNRPVSNLLSGAQVGQGFQANALNQQLLGQKIAQQEAIAPIEQQLAEQRLAAGQLGIEQKQAILDQLGVPDEPTAKQVAFNTAKLSALPTVEAKLEGIAEMKQQATAAGRTTANLDELEQVYAISPQKGDELLGATVNAFQQTGFLTAQEKDTALQDSEAAEQAEISKAATAQKVLKLSSTETQAFTALDPKVQDKLLQEALSPKEKAKVKEEVIRTKKGLAVRKSAVKILENILSDKNKGALRDVVGPIEGRFDFRFQGDEADLVAQITELGDTLTADNLDLMSGVLSESDIALLKNLSAGGLNRAVNEETFRGRAVEILGRLRGEIGEPQRQPQGEIITLPNGKQVKRLSTGVSG